MSPSIHTSLPRGDGVQLAAGKDCSCGHAIGGFPIGRQRTGTPEAMTTMFPVVPSWLKTQMVRPCSGRGTGSEGPGSSAVNQQGGRGGGGSGALPLQHFGPMLPVGKDSHC